MLTAIQQWDEIKRIQAFFRDAEASAAELAGEPQRVAMEKLAQARALIGELDALKALMEWKGPQER
ncbi:hypothetical protein D3C85_1806180 [compost metagenome]